MCTDRPVPSVVAGTVTLKTSVTVRSSAVAGDLGATAPDRLNDGSTRADDVVVGRALGRRRCRCTTSPVTSASVAYGPPGASPRRTS